MVQPSAGQWAGASRIGYPGAARSAGPRAPARASSRSRRKSSRPSFIWNGRGPPAAARPGPARCRDADLPQRRAGQRDAALELPGVMRPRRSPLRGPHVVGADPLGGVRHLVPQLQDAGQQRKPLGAAHRPARLRRRLPGGDQRPGGVVRRVPVVGHLDGGAAGRNQRRIGVDGLGEAAVQPAVLARQQVFVHRLADQLVPERVAVGPARAARWRSPRAAARGSAPRRPGRSPRPSSACPVVSPPALADPQHLLGVLRQPAHAVEQQVAEGFGQLRVQLAVTAEQGLDEQRVALGTVVQRVGQRLPSGWRPRMPATSSPVSCLVRRGSSIRSTQAIRSSRRAAGAADGCGAARRSGTSRRSAAR